MKVKSLYGFSPELPPFVDKAPAEQAALLRSWGNTAVFGGHQNPEFVDAVHAAGIKVYAEFGCFVGADWWKQFPASRPITATGDPLEKEDWYCGVNPTVPQVRQERLAALEKLLADVCLDGVWLDFIRWPCHWESPAPYLPRTSFDADTLARFSRDTGIHLPLSPDCQIPPPPGFGNPGRAKLFSDDIPAIAQTLLEQHAAEWTAWRCAQITSWVAEARGVLDLVRPDAILGLFGVPWRLADHDGAILDVIGQDYRALGQYVDVFSPMVYHRMCGQPPEWVGDVVEEIHELSGKPVWPIIQSVDAPTPLSAKGYGQALDIALRNRASDGVLVFTMEEAVLDETKLAVTKAKFG